MSKASLVKNQYLKSRRHQRRREYHPHHHHHHHHGTQIEEGDTIVVLPSAYQYLVDESVQVSSSSLESGDIYNLRPHHRQEGILPLLPHVEPPHIPHQTHNQHFYSRIPKLINTPPEQIRGTILNHGETYWSTAESCTKFMARCSGAHAILYILIFGLSAPHRTALALFPARGLLIEWYLIMTAVDIGAYIIILAGNWFSKRFELPKTVDLIFLLVATVLLGISFLASLTYPVYSCFFLVTKVQGTINRNNTECLQARDKFNREGTDWNVINELRKICEANIHCIENCRDFRGLFFWIFGTYAMTCLRFLVHITLWNSCSFVYLIMNLHEERVSYTFALT